MNTMKAILAAGVLAGAVTQADAATYTIDGSFNVDAVVFGSTLSIPMSILSGSYDDVAGAGNWHASANLSGLGMGTITWDQTFTLNGATGTGVLNAATNCQGNGIACGGIGPEFRGPINAGGAIVAGLQNWVVTTPNFGSPTFAPNLTADAPEVPVPAAAWLFGSGLLGLAGTARRRSKK